MVLYHHLPVQVSWPERGNKKQKTKPPPASNSGRVNTRPKRPITWEIEVSQMKPDQKRRRRAQYRARSMEANLPGPSKLRRSAVSAAARLRYEKMKEAFDRWSQQRSHSDMFTALENYLDHLYLNGEDLSIGTYTVAGITYFDPELKVDARMAKVQQSPQGWRRFECLCPSKPSPWRP